MTSFEQPIDWTARDEVPPRGTRRMRLTGPPRWLFHACCALPAWLLVLSSSLPGFGFGSWIAGVAAAALLALVWVVRLVLWLVSARARTGGGAWRFAVAPVGGLLVGALVASGLAFDARWAMSRAAFDDVRCDAAPGRLGWFDITSVRAVDGGCLLYESNGALFDDAGFAYLPEGPTRALENAGLEVPRWHHLGGPWWSFTASW